MVSDADADARPKVEKVIDDQLENVHVPDFDEVVDLAVEALGLDVDQPRPQWLEDLVEEMFQEKGLD